MTGSVALTCAQRDGRSYLSRIRYDGLSRVSRPQRAGDAAHVVLAHLGPGVIGGDRYTLDVRVEPDASLLVTGQMATPVYARDASSSVDASWQVAGGASLVVRAEPVMLDAGARHDMRTALDVAGDGRAILADVVTVPPTARARLRTIVRIDGRIVVRDACDLHGIAGAVATVIIACPGPERRERIIEALAPLVASTEGAIGGIGGSADVVIVRARSEAVWGLQQRVASLIAAATRGLRWRTIGKTFPSIPGPLEKEASRL